MAITKSYRVIDESREDHSPINMYCEKESFFISQDNDVISAPLHSLTFMMHALPSNDTDITPPQYDIDDPNGTIDLIGVKPITESDGREIVKITQGDNNIHVSKQSAPEIKEVLNIFQRFLF